MSEYKPEDKFVWKEGDIEIEYPDDCEEVDWNNLEEDDSPDIAD